MRSKLLRGTGQVLARLGVARLAPQGVALGGPGTFLHHLEEVMGQGLLASVHLGPPRANRKPVLHLMDVRGRSVAYVKLGINELTCQRVRNEAVALRRLADVTLSGLVVPELFDAGQWRDLDYLVMRPVATGTGLISSPELRARAMGALVEAFPTSRADLEQSPWWARTMANLDKCGNNQDATGLRAAATQLLERYGDVSVLHGAGHGDFSPWNACAHPHHLVVWDWERFSLDVPVGWDEIHYSLNAYPGGPAAALAEASGDLIERFDPHMGSAPDVLIASYLLDRGVNYLVDRQQEAGLRRGPLGKWLLPALQELVGPRQS